MQGIFRFMLECVVLNGLAHTPSRQAILLVCIESLFLLPVLYKMPYSGLAASRIEIVNAVGRLLTYGTAVMLAINRASEVTVVMVIFILQGFMVAHANWTGTTWPLVKRFIPWLNTWDTLNAEGDDNQLGLPSTNDDQRSVSIDRGPPQEHAPRKEEVVLEEVVVGTSLDQPSNHNV